jgi:hypothetical protein
MLKRRAGLSAEEAANVTRFHLWQEQALVDSIERFLPIGNATRAEAMAFLNNIGKLLGEVKPRASEQGDGRLVFRRNRQVLGPMSAFGYDYFTDHYGAERENAIRLLQYRGLRGSGGEYSYEVLNLVNGRRTAGEIRDSVSAIYGPVPLEMIAEYLRALELIKIIQPAR